MTTDEEYKTEVIKLSIQDADGEEIKKCDLFFNHRFAHGIMYVDAIMPEITLDELYKGFGFPSEKDALESMTIDIKITLSDFSRLEYGERIPENRIQLNLVQSL